MLGGGQESATNLSAYRYLQNTVDDMSGWGWFSLGGVLSKIVEHRRTVRFHL